MKLALICNWCELPSLPFDTDPAAIARHAPSGWDLRNGRCLCPECADNRRIAIASANAAAQARGAARKVTP